MNEQEIFARAREITDKVEEYKALRHVIQKLDSDIENNVDMLPNIREFSTLIKEVKNYAPTNLYPQVVNLFNSQYIKLISKRQVIDQDGERAIGISQAGLGLSMYSRWNTSFDYLPSNSLSKYYLSNTFNNYNKILKHSTEIISLIHKKDKKELIEIGARFMQEWDNLDETKFAPLIVHTEPQTREVIQAKYIAQLGSVQSIENVRFENLQIDSTEYGLRINVNNTMFNLFNTDSKNELLLLNTVLKIPEFKAGIKQAVREYGEVMREKADLVNKLKEDFEPYMVLDLL